MRSTTNGRDDDGFRLGIGRVVASTEKALSVALDPSSLLGAKKIWVPRSVIHSDSELFDALDHASGELVVEEWFARREGWVTE